MITTQFQNTERPLKNLQSVGKAHPRARHPENNDGPGNPSRRARRGGIKKRRGIYNNTEAASKVFGFGAVCVKKRALAVISRSVRI